MCIRMKINPPVETILKAISNKKRLEILNFIQEEQFLIKNDLITHFGLQRAGLDFHLASLEEARLIGLLEIRIRGRKFVFVFPKATWKIDLDLVETASLQDLIPTELSENDFQKLTERFWTDSSTVRNPQTIKKILESLATRLGSDKSDYSCQRCGKDLGIMKCSECQNLYCVECAEIIEKTDGSKLTLCYECIADKFS